MRREQFLKPFNLALIEHRHDLGELREAVGRVYVTQNNNFATNMLAYCAQALDVTDSRIAQPQFERAVAMLKRQIYFI